MVFIVNSKTLVVQSNRLVEAKYRLSVEEQKIIKILISKIKRDDVDFKDYEFRIKDLAGMLGMEHKDPYGVLEKVTERLTTRSLKFFNPETQTLLQTAWLSSAEYKKGQGTVALCFDPKLKPLLLQLQSYFTKYELGQVMKFRGQYTIRFFELQKSFLGRNKKEVSFTLKDLREMLGLKKDEYKEFFNLKARVLEPARIELLEKTGEAFAWEAMRQGRGGKVVGVRFVFDGEVQTAPVEDMPKVSKAQEKQPQLALVTESQAVTPEVEGVAELVGVGVSARTAQALAVAHGAEKVREKLGMLEGVKDVKNPAGFVARAIREDWHDEKAQEQKKRLERRTEEQRIANRKKELGKLKKKYNDIAKEIVNNYYDGLPEEEKKRVQDTFSETQTTFGKLKIGLGFSGWAFHSFLNRQFGHLVPSEQDFLQKEGQYLSDEDWQVWGEV